MSASILVTKLNIPPLRENRTTRPRLLAQLALALKCKLTLVSAPAGYGKTTLLCEWENQIRSGGKTHLCWLSLDATDNDPRQFWAYFIRALQPAIPQLSADLLETLETAELIRIENILTPLLNEIASQDKQFALILDDFHLIASPSIHEGLTFLLDHLPTQLHLVLSTRIDPPWQLARLRSQQQILEIRQGDLRFSLAETSAFLNTVMQLDLMEADIQALDGRTEGWIAALQMAAISMTGRENPAAFIRSFTGSHRFVLDYLMEEVLDQQSPDVREFLIKTSILERLTGPLCDAVVDISDSLLILSALEQKNLFLIPLDHTRQWYRYHHLFADLLRNRLAQNQASEIPELHRRASHWYQRQGFVFDAVQHALTANDYDMAADLVEQHVVAFKDHGELPSVMRWLDSLPEQVVFARPWLCVAKSWVLAYLGEPDTVRFLLDKAEKGLSMSELDQTNAAIRGHVAAIRCYLALLDGTLEASTMYGYQALEFLPADDLQTRISVAITLASALRFQGKLEEANQVLTKAALLGRKVRTSPITIRLTCAMAVLQYTQGQLPQAVETLQSAIRTAQKIDADGETYSLALAGPAYIRLAKIQAAMYNLDEALASIEMGIKLSEQWGQANALWEGYRNYAAILNARGDFSAARQAMQKAADASQRIASPFAEQYTIAQKAFSYATEGDIPAAVAQIEQLGLQSEAEIDYFQADIYGIWAYILFAQGNSGQALRLLRKIQTTAQKVGAVDLAVGVETLQAVIYLKSGDEPRAWQALSHAVELAETAGIVQDFVEEGAALRPLLCKLLRRGKSSTFIQRLLEAIDQSLAAQGKSTSPVKLIDPLTARELEMLRLLDTSMDSGEIADQLVISISTVRTHIRNIYAKLGVNRRMEAIQRGRELGLL